MKKQQTSTSSNDQQQKVDLHKYLQQFVLQQLQLIHAESCALTIAEPNLVCSTTAPQNTNNSNEDRKSKNVFSSMFSEHFTLSTAKYFLRENSGAEENNDDN